MTDSKSRCVDEISTDTRPIVYLTIDRLSTDHRLTIDRLSTNYRPTVDRYIDRLSTAISTAMSTDISVDITHSKQDPIKPGLKAPKSKALNGIYILLKQNIKSRNAKLKRRRRTVKKQLGLISEQLCTCSTLFCILCRYFARLQQETFRNFLITTGYTFYGGNVILVLVHFLYWRSFSPWWCSFRSFRTHQRAYFLLSPPLTPRAGGQ